MGTQQHQHLIGERQLVLGSRHGHVGGDGSDRIRQGEVAPAGRPCLPRRVLRQPLRPQASRTR